MDEITTIALNTQLDTFFVFNPVNKQALRWNSAFIETSGYTDNEIASLPAPDSYYGPEDLERAKIFTQKILDQGKGTIELDLICKNGKKIPTEYRVAVIKGDDDESTYIISIGRDITERKQVEQELRYRENLFRTAIESFPADLFALDCNQHYTIQNSVSKKMWGDITGKSPSDVAPNNDVLSMWTKNNRRVLDGETVKGEISAIVHGEVRHYFNIISPITDLDSITGILGINVDITDRKQTEEAYRVLVETSLQALVIRQNGRIVFANPASERLSGYSFMELLKLDNPIQALIHPEDLPGIIDRLQCRSRGEKISSLARYRIVQKSGDLRWVESQTAQIQFRGESAEHTVFIDITDRMKMEEQLRQSEKMQAVGQLAGGIAHDFNNQLCAILAFADMLRCIKKDDTETVEYCDNIISSVRNASDLTSKLLAFSRKGNYVLLPTDMHQLIGEVTQVLRHTIDRCVTIKHTLAASFFKIMGDASQLQNAVLNIGLNARDAMPDGGELHISTENVKINEPTHLGMGQQLRIGTYLRITIADTGVGIPDKIITTIFEPFFTTKEPGKGTGMGLSAVLGTITSHGGVIDVQSTPGAGTSFIIYLIVNDEAASSPQTHENRTIPHGEGNILLVDDEELICEATRNILVSIGYSVHICTDAKQAVEYFHTSHSSIDLVILDMVMPGLNGKEVFRRLKDIRKDIKVLIFSGYSTKDTLKEILDAGANGFIQKPFSNALLAQNVSRIIGG